MRSKILWLGVCGAGIAFGIVGRAWAADQLALRAEGEQRSLDCKGLDVVIEGNRNTYTLRGGCNSVTLRGEADHVHVAVAPGAHITVEGNDVQLTWTLAGSGPDPVVSVNGRDSTAVREGGAPNTEASLRLLPPPKVTPPVPPSVPRPPDVANAPPPEVRTPPAPASLAPAMPPPAPQAAPERPAPLVAKSILPRIDITIDREVRDLDCSGRDVNIKADHGLYALRGGCTAVIVHGDDDLVQAELEPGARIELVGKNAKLAYVMMGEGAPPSVHIDGADSKAWRIKAWGALTGDVPK